ncbi:hypothetical protein J3R82DRAFT_1993 [Butyriboletus roseoflavus]|nr:hypothetical protein J3R82DRAFT_1993 [Butyriboletus roseoflavus]
MHSFAPALIIAAMATLSSAAPVGLPSTSLTVSVPVPLPTNLPSVPLPTGTTLPVSEGEAKSAIGAVHARHVITAINSIQSDVSDVRVRTATPSLAVIFDTISTEIQPYTEQLTYLVPSNSTITEITSIIGSIKAPIVAAIPQLQALAGQEASIILASVDAVAGDAGLTVSQVAGIVGGHVDLVLSAAGNVLNVTSAEGGDIVADVKGVLTDLGYILTSLVGATVPLVDGLSASLTSVVTPVDSVMSDLDLIDLAILLDLSI